MLFRTSESNSCVLQALKELWSQKRPDHSNNPSDDPVFVALTRSRTANGGLQFNRLSAQRLSRVFRIALFARAEAIDTFIVVTVTD